MGIYSIQGVNESTVSSYLDDIQTEEIVEENYMEAALRHTYEINENMHNVMKAIGIAELAVYEESGQEIQYIDESASGIFNKIKEMLKKVWEKISSLFKKFLAKMESFGKDDAAFVKKYRQQIVTGSTKGLSVKGYKFSLDALVVNKAFKQEGMGILTILDAISDVASVDANNLMNADGSINYNLSEKDFDELMKKINSADNNEIVEKLRGIALNDGKTYNQKEYNQELFEKFRSGESSKETLDDTDIKPTEMCNFLLGSSKTKKAINDDFKDLYKIIKEDIKSVDKMEKEMTKYDKDDDDDDVKMKGKFAQLFSKVGNLLVQTKTMAEQMEAAKMNAYNDCRRQYKAICVKLIGRKEKNESAYYDDDLSYTNESSVNSFLDNVKLI